MLLQYANKKTEHEIISQTKRASLALQQNNQAHNKLFLGDNLRVLKTLHDELGYKGKIDLVYIDPPFATNTHFRINDQRTSTISSSMDDDIAYSDTLVGGEFLEFLRERLYFLRELLSDEGSIYLHIDYKIGHYVKLIMDEVFGAKNFRNDITRIKCNPKNFSRKAFGNTKDLILFYSKSNNPIWNDPKIEYTEEDVKKLFRKVDEKNRRYTTIPLHAPGETKNGNTGKEWRGLVPPKGRHWRSDPSILDKWESEGLIEWSKNGVPRKKIFVDNKGGKKAQDIWDFKDPQYPNYPTEKNIDLLKFIINASSNDDSFVLDCFCGSGTTLLAAQMLGRKWIGIDQSEHAIKVSKKRIEEMPDNLFATKDFDFYVES
jgi:adenine-specific DNA-methyltransferase